MKHLITSLFFLCALTMNAQSTVVTGPKKQQTTATKPKTKPQQPAKPKASPKPTTGVTNGHEWVDLGLPSGTLWATCNVGASNPEEYGDYFAWGETRGYMSGKRVFTKDTYFDTTDGHAYGKYNSNRTELSVEDDAANVNWEADWHIPSDKQWQELRDRCTWAWTTRNGKSGLLVKSRRNGASIFLPAAGGCFNDKGFSGIGEIGFYWACSLPANYPWNAYRWCFSSTGCHMDENCSRFQGLSVRPVRQK